MSTLYYILLFSARQNKNGKDNLAVNTYLFWLIMPAGERLQDKHPRMNRSQRMCQRQSHTCRRPQK
jgi:hypothetical protein